ncbi:HNH endonuclease signature motif containing protein [Nonomuraea sp. NPDC049504]|uniref:HNH endonuclease n=1 Tax=Nonomuraea sp. NPDC049504 TaxID=3154729 RepID=UPI003449AA68
MGIHGWPPAGSASRPLAVVLHAYERRCAISGDRIRPVLQAAHIRPVAVGGEHRLDNGLLLRSDVHTLFDRGYLAVDPKPAFRS